MKERFFKNVVANIILTFAVVCVVFIGFSGDLWSVMSSGDNSNKPHYIGNTQKNQVSLMFNVYSSESLTIILDVLDQKNVKATFFIGGVWAAKNGDLLKEIATRGHELGNHGYLHLDHKKLNRERNREEIDLTERVIFDNTGITTKLFAPPSGSFSNTTLEVAAELGYQTVMWTADTIDWRDQDEELIKKRVDKKLCNGALVLMHPTKATGRALPKMIDNIIEKGYKIVTVGQNLV